MRFSFATPGEFQASLATYHETAPDLIRRVTSRRARGCPSITWPESVDQALCFGWIDGPHAVASTPSATASEVRPSRRAPQHLEHQSNIRRFGDLDAEGLITPAGHLAFAAPHRRAVVGVYAHEQTTEPGAPTCSRGAVPCEHRRVGVLLRPTSVLSPHRDPPGDERKETRNPRTPARASHRPLCRGATHPQLRWGAKTVATAVPAVRPVGPRLLWQYPQSSVPASRMHAVGPRPGEQRVNSIHPRSLHASSDVDHLVPRSLRIWDRRVRREFETLNDHAREYHDAHVRGRASART